MRVYHCWACGAPNDNHREYRGEDVVDPAPGDASICLLCGHLGVFTEDGTRQATLIEARQLAAEPAVLEALCRWDAGEDLRSR